jgi:transcriptional regulator with XRE-family HTH domain
MAHPSSFSAWLRAQRHALGLTQAELGSRAGCSAAAIRKFEAGERRPSTQIAERLAAAIDLANADRPAFVALARRAAAPSEISPVVALALQPSPFVGRDHELADLARLLARPDCRLLTLIGLGGVGKTCLALHVAQAQAAAFADGVTVVQLAGVTLGASRRPANARPRCINKSGIRDRRALAERKSIVSIEQNTIASVCDSPSCVLATASCLLL